MARNQVRLLHAASVQLDCALRDVGTLPRDAVDLVATATLTAWERLIDAAIAHDVDALILSGDTFDAALESLPADVALRQGLDKLGEQQIPVLITPGSLDPLSAWNEIPSLPDHVTVFDSPWDSPVELTDRGNPLATLLPVTAGTDVSPPELERIRSGKGGSSQRPPTIGILWDTTSGFEGDPDRDLNEQQRFASLDALLCRETSLSVKLPLTEGRVFRQSAPQGMDAASTGGRGATLLQFDSGQPSARFLALGPIRREHLFVRLDAARHRDDLSDHMLASLDELSAVPGEQLRLIRWSFLGSLAARERLDWSDDAAREITAIVQDLTDQPNRLRYAHAPVPTWQDETDPAEIGELWQDFLNLFDQQPALSIEELQRLALELRPQQAVAGGAWERWLHQLNASSIAARSRRYGRRWFIGA